MRLGQSVSPGIRTMSKYAGAAKVRPKWGGTDHTCDSGDSTV